MADPYGGIDRQPIGRAALPAGQVHRGEHRHSRPTKIQLSRHLPGVVGEVGAVIVRSDPDIQDPLHHAQSTANRRRRQYRHGSSQPPNQNTSIPGARRDQGGIDRVAQRAESQLFNPGKSGPSRAGGPGARPACDPGRSPYPHGLGRAPSVRPPAGGSILCWTCTVPFLTCHTGLPRRTVRANRVAAPLGHSPTSQAAK